MEAEFLRFGLDKVVLLELLGFNRTKATTCFKITVPHPTNLSLAILMAKKGVGYKQKPWHKNWHFRIQESVTWTK